MNWYLAALKKYATFSGRSRRMEYWMFALFNLIISLVLVAIEMATGIGPTKDGQFMLPNLYNLAVLVPSLAVTVRRLHDTGRTGWWVLIALVPCIGAIVLLIYMIQDSEAGSNQYGPFPKSELPE